VTERKTFTEGSLITGAPARVARSLEDAQKQLILFSAAHYVDNWRRYKKDLQPSRRG
jgi:carbonic anhydrase/acetyltransferase-like protein (isoleucine patch superfamily)